MKILQSLSSKKTQEVGERLAKNLIQKRSGVRNRQTSAVIALQGELGAGKTTFVQGFLRGMGMKRHAQSPTFIIMRRHGLPKRPGGFKNIFHIDAYRLKNPDHMKALGFEAIVQDPQNVILVEWPELLKKLLPRHTTWIMLQHGAKENIRRIRIKKL